MIEDIIKRGDRVDFKAWLKKATDRDIKDIAPKMLACTVQDFFELYTAEARKRRLIR
jgi:hypothetical protein